MARLSTSVHYEPSAIPISVGQAARQLPQENLLTNAAYESHYDYEYTLPDHVTRIMTYGDHVILDSGATDHMHRTVDDLSLVTACYKTVLLADNHAVEVDEEGCLVLQVYCHLHKCLCSFGRNVSCSWSFGYSLVGNKIQ
jgi:hypothetical protein